MGDNEVKALFAGVEGEQIALFETDVGQTYLPDDFATRLATAFIVLATFAAVGCAGDAPGGSLLGRTLLTGPERSAEVHGDWDDVDNAVAVAAAKTEMAVVDQSTDENGDRVYELLTIADEPARIRVPTHLLAVSGDWLAPPEDLTITPLDYWDFGTKTMYYGGATMDPMLSGIDPDTGQPRCHRDDTNPSPTDKQVLRALEPNDLPPSAISLSNPLMADPPTSSMGSPYEICSDRSAPNVPDVDVFRFKLSSPAKVIAEVKYNVAFGDLDAALFLLAKNPDTGADQPQRVLADLTATSNACIEANNLMPGTYFLVVRGTTTPEKPGVYSLNNYSVRVYTTTMGASCVKKDGGM